MKRYQKGEPVKAGFYLNFANGEYIHLDHPDPVIPANAEGEFVRVPAGLVIFTVPLAGLAYVMFLPAAAIVGLVAYTGAKLRNLATLFETHRQTR